MSLTFLSNICERDFESASKRDVAPELQAARLIDINLVRRGPVNLDVEGPLSKLRMTAVSFAGRWRQMGNNDPLLPSGLQASQRPEW